MGELIRVPGEMLLDMGFVSELPANNATMYVYRPNPDNPECEHVVELPYRDQYVWCPICAAEHHSSQLKRVYLAPRMAQVWWSHENLATGQVESDPKRFKTHLSDAGKRHEDRLGFPAQYEPTDPTELRRAWADRGVDIEVGLDATHDHRVRTGEKPSKGKFVY